MNVKFIIVDDSDIKEYRKLKEFLLSRKNCICVMGANGYKNSVLLGIRLSLNYKPDSIIIMDADHPPHTIKEMIRSLNENDVVVGYDSTDNIQRKVTNFLCNDILKMDLSHPTCGFWGFNVNVIDEIEPWNVKSEYDISHVEWLLQSRRKGLKIGQVSFTSNVEHEYNIKRYLRWLYDFMRIMFI